MKTRWSWLEGAPGAQDASLGGLAGASWLGVTWTTRKAAIAALAEDVMPGTHTLVRIGDAVDLAPYRLRAVQLPLLRVARSCETCTGAWSAPVNSRATHCPRCRTEARTAYFRSTLAPGAA